MTSNEEIYNALEDNCKKRIIMYLTGRQFKNAIPIEEMTIIPAKNNGLSENAVLSFGGILKITARGDKIISKQIPFLVNKAFSCEVYLKFLLLEFNVDFCELKGKKGHDLLELYKKLPAEIKESLLKYLHSKGTLTNDSLLKKLESISQVFVEWRYIYENFDGISADYMFLDNFCDFLDKCCSDIILNNYKYNVLLDAR